MSVQVQYELRSPGATEEGYSPLSTSDNTTTTMPINMMTTKSSRLPLIWFLLGFLFVIDVLWVFLVLPRIVPGPKHESDYTGLFLFFLFFCSIPFSPAGWYVGAWKINQQDYPGTINKGLRIACICLSVIVIVLFVAAILTIF